MPSPLTPNRLTDEVITSALPGAKPRKLADGKGLCLLVNPNGSRWWRFNYYRGSKRNTLSCGSYHATTIEAALEKRAYFRSLVAQGIDPSAQQRAERSALSPVPARYSIDSDGALTVHLPKRAFVLTHAETLELRVFLEATRSLGESTSCP